MAPADEEPPPGLVAGFNPRKYCPQRARPASFFSRFSLARLGERETKRKTWFDLQSWMAITVIPTNIARVSLVMGCPNARAGVQVVKKTP